MRAWCGVVGWGGVESVEAVVGGEMKREDGKTEAKEEKEEEERRGRN
jgi:hypothetical protein